MKVIKCLSNLKLHIVDEIVAYIREVGTRKARSCEYWIAENESNQYLITKQCRVYSLHDFIVDEKEFMDDFKKIAQNLTPYDILDLIKDIPAVREALKDVWIEELELGWRV